jgi:L-fucose dehydrogenase
MDLDLEHRVILVTGGANGIGAAVVRSCAREGSVPVILDRDEIATRELQAELRQKDYRSEAVLIDLTDCAHTCRRGCRTKVWPKSMGL